MAPAAASLPPPHHRLLVEASPAALARTVAAHVAATCRAAVAARRRARLVLAGGATPRATYERLAGDGLRAQVPWPHIDVFWGDERHVPPTHPDSNYRMADEALLRHVPLDPARVHRMCGEWPDPADAAARYEQEIHTACGLRAGETPAFDLVLLGMGPDGHVASLFPGSPALEEATRLVVAPWVPHLGAHRITMTWPALLGARAIAVLVAGAAKAAVLRAALLDPADVPKLPAHALRNAAGAVTWFADADAAPWHRHQAAP